jgi:hypothetical protein
MDITRDKLRYAPLNVSTIVSTDTHQVFIEPFGVISILTFERTLAFTEPKEFVRIWLILL